MRPLIGSSSGLSARIDGEVQPDNTGQRLHLSVVATTDGGTSAALAAARDLGLGLDPQVVLFAPHVVPYLQPLNHPANPVPFTADRYRKLVEAAGIDVLVQVCVCRPDAASLEALIPAGATVIVGGTRGRWLRTHAQRLAKRLAARGYHVMFIEEQADTAGSTRFRDRNRGASVTL